MKEFLRMMRQYASPYKGYLGGAVVLNILSAIFNVFSFAVIIPILNILFKLDTTQYAFMPWDTPGAGFKDILVNNAYYYVQSFALAHGAINTLLLLCAVMALMTILKTSCYFGASAVMIPIRTGIVKDIRGRIYRKILALPIGFFSQERKGDIIARMSGDVAEVEASITASIEMLIKDPILILIYFAILTYVSPEMMVFTIVFVPPFVWVMGVIGKQLKRQSVEAQTLWSDTMSQVEETLGGLRVVKAFNAEKKMAGRFEHIIETYRRKIARVSTRQALAHPVSELLGTIMILIVVCFGGAMIISGKSIFGGSFIDAPTFIFFIIILCREVLRGVTLDIEKGRTVAIVGESGAGKSTLVDLIPRFYDTTGGEIRIDGIPLKDLRIKDLRGLMGNVNQDPILFNDTIFNNIAYGVENATEEEVVAAAKIANAHEFIMEKEEGYQTNIGDRGVKLSGGQRQRISIARAILKNPPILILDEATASLDTESERIVQEALDRLMSTRTTIAIAHRLSTVRNADEIIVLHEGEVVERGRHEELLALGGYYKKLNDMQAL